VSAACGDAVPLPVPLQPAAYYMPYGYDVDEKYAIFAFRLKVIDFGFVEYGICSME
jgi:hypothetical protein